MGRDSSQNRKAVEEPDGERCLADWVAGSQQPADDPVLGKLLKLLDDTRREHPPILHLVKEGIDVFAGSQRPRQRIRRGNCVLDGEIDSNPADRRHCVSGIADRKQSRSIPAC